jgi:hypothetical protein
MLVNEEVFVARQELSPSTESVMSRWLPRTVCLLKIVACS